MDIESALQALSNPAGPYEEAATFLALTPAGDERIAPALRNWLETWMRVHGQQGSLYGKFVIDEVTGRPRPADAPKHTRPIPCLLALGVHGSTVDDDLLARFSEFPASTVAWCRLQGKEAPRALVLETLEVFRKNWELNSGWSWTSEELLEYWLDVLIPLIPVAPDQVLPVMRNLITTQAAASRAGQSRPDGLRLAAREVSRVTCAIIEALIHFPPRQRPSPAVQSELLGLISTVFRDGRIPPAVSSELRIRSLPEAMPAIQEWLHNHPASVAREQLKARLAELSTQSVPDLLAPGAMCYSMAPPPDRYDYRCPRCHAKTIYVREDCGDAADSNPGWPDPLDDPRLPSEVHIQHLLPVGTREIVDCRRIVDTIAVPWLQLDESQFCRRCSPDVRNPQLLLVVLHDGEPNAHITAGISLDDVKLVREFLGGALTHRQFNDGESPLFEHIERLQELLGVRANS